MVMLEHSQSLNDKWLEPNRFTLITVTYHQQDCDQAQKDGTKSHNGGLNLIGEQGAEYLDPWVLIGTIN